MCIEQKLQKLNKVTVNAMRLTKLCDITTILIMQQKHREYDSTEKYTQPLFVQLYLFASLPNSTMSHIIY